MQLVNANGNPNVLGNIKQLASNAKKMAKKYEYWKKEQMFRMAYVICMARKRPKRIHADIVN